MSTEQRIQLDRFADSADAVTERELVAALREGRRAEARERAERLADLRPDHPRLHTSYPALRVGGWAATCLEDFERCMADVARIGRNEPCLCGSGRKCKKCCGARA